MMIMIIVMHIQGIGLTKPLSPDVENAFDLSIFFWSSQIQYDTGQSAVDEDLPFLPRLFTYCATEWCLIHAGYSHTKCSLFFFSIKIFGFALPKENNNLQLRKNAFGQLFPLLVVRKGAENKRLRRKNWMNLVPDQKHHHENYWLYFARQMGVPASSAQKATKLLNLHPDDTTAFREFYYSDNEDRIFVATDTSIESEQ